MHSSSIAWCIQVCLIFISSCKSRHCTLTPVFISGGLGGGGIPLWIPQKGTPLWLPLLDLSWAQEGRRKGFPEASLGQPLFRHPSPRRPFKPKASSVGVLWQGCRSSLRKRFDRRLWFCFLGGGEIAPSLPRFWHSCDISGEAPPPPSPPRHPAASCWGGVQPYRPSQLKRKAVGM